MQPDKTDKGSNDYTQRQSSVNTAELLFESFCNQKGYIFTKVGFDEKNGSVQNFYKVNRFLRNLPDYIVNTNNGTFVVNVKGTGNFKRNEIDMFPMFMQIFHTENAKLIYAFCFTGKDPIFIYPGEIIKRYENSHDKRWSDGVVYRNLNL